MAKYPEWTGRIEALLNVLGGGAIADGLVSGELKFTITEGEEPTAKVETAVRGLFNRHGRRIPPKGLTGKVVAANRDFHLIQPSLDYAVRLARLQQFFPKGTVFCSTEEFAAGSSAILKQIADTPTLANLTKGVHLPIVLPRLAVGDDYGKTLEETFVAAMEGSYKAQFEGREFSNYVKGKLAGQVTVVAGTRHDQLIARMATGPVVGIYFPAALQGFAITADREQIASLPDWLLLPGGLDLATALVAYPDVLARDFKTPGLDMAALSWGSQGSGLYLKAYDDRLELDGAGDLVANDFYSGGLLALGEVPSGA